MFWIVAGLGIAFPWLLGDGFQFFLRPVSECTISSIYDGDTLRATCGGNKKVKVRLYCIDTPEMGQKPWGTESRDYLRRIAPKTVRLVEHDRDRYGRIVGEVFDGDTSLNLAMVEAGRAAVYPKYCSEARFFAAQGRARAVKRGIWAHPGDQQRPWEWRQRR
ncbi:thermonuclease family protein [Imhoffiella purpurea]|uniref:Nuclease (Thermonuclease) like protein n=1 Tax=Imhoffiella purpurea TaxID=1249627 RepID=W9V253_9GAMM|nr:thermonuclease family protein [Imhoffiella purpurea]EXJ13573.1 Nuclease (thermonuclease) like protein [Imhoffiella purpurea]